QLSKIVQRTGQPVNFVDHHRLNLAGPDVGHQTLECGAFEITSGISAVIVFRRQQAPALVPLTLDVAFGRLAVGMQRIELLLQTPPPRTCGCRPRTNEWLPYWPSLRTSAVRPCPLRRPKKAGPFQRVPVISRATWERLPKTLPWC